MTLPREILRRIKDIESDTTNSSLSLTKKAATTVQRLVKISRHLSPSEFRRNLHRVCKDLIRAQPAMAALVNLAETISVVADRSSEKALFRDVRRTGKEYVRRLDESSNLIAQCAVNIIRSDTTVVTHSFSSVVLKTFLLARSRGKRFRVICTESRPMYEGVALARKLGRNGIPTTVVTDAAVFSYLSEASCVVVGADAVTPSAVINKVGTFPIALAANAQRVPFFVLCCSQKFIPVSREVALENLAEILGRRPLRSVAARDIYFDSTPHSYVTRIIGEKGFLTPRKFIRSSKSAMPASRFRPLP